MPLRLVEEPYEFGATAIGLMGLLGAGGALGASLAGRYADRGRSTAVSMTAFGLIALSFALSFAVMSPLSSSLLVLALGVVLVDLAVQAAHITNQTAVFQHVGDAQRSRVTTAYMTSYFLGGALASAAMGPAWEHGGWGAATLLGCACGGAALLLVAGQALARRHGKTAPAGTGWRGSPTIPPCRR